jgi:hypothetical protein
MTLFEKLASEIGLGPVVTEHLFHPKRQWRFDYAFPQAMVALEVEGGLWTHGRHTRGRGYEKDCEKYNEAVVMGWRLVRCAPQQRDDGSILQTLRRLV